MGPKEAHLGTLSISAIWRLGKAVKNPRVSEEYPWRRAK